MFTLDEGKNRHDWWDFPELEPCFLLSIHGDGRGWLAVRNGNMVYYLGRNSGYHLSEFCIDDPSSPKSVRSMGTIKNTFLPMKILYGGILLPWAVYGKEPMEALHTLLMLQARRRGVDAG